MSESTNVNENIDLNNETNETEGVNTTVESNGELNIETPISEEILEVSTDTTDSLESFIVNENVVETIEEDASLEDIMNDLNETPNPVVAPVTRSTRIPFAERAANMGLTVLPGKTYHYADRFSEVAYKNVKTLEGSGIVDDTEIPHLTIFTKGVAANDEWSYQNIISDAYQFVGNDTLVEEIKSSIAAVGNPEIQERTFINPNYTELRHELIIMNGTTVPEVGSILPMMQVSNTYNGTGASMITFGMTIIEPNNDQFSLAADKLGKIRQIHITGSNTELSAALGSYVSIFNANIMAVIAENFAKQVTIEEMMELLDTIEKKVGKKRREVIAASLPTTPEAGQTWNLNAWQLFLALTRFTSVEKNISSKRILENVVESVLILPAQMIESLKTINV